MIFLKGTAGTSTMRLAVCTVGRSLKRKMSEPLRKLLSEAAGTCREKGVARKGCP